MLIVFNENGGEFSNNIFTVINEIHCKNLYIGNVALVALRSISYLRRYFLK